MTVRPVPASDQTVEVVDGGGQVRPLSFVDEESADLLQPLTIHGRTVHPLDEFDRVFFHGAPR